MQDVGGVGEEVRPHVGRRLTREFREVLGQLPLAVAPGEVRVRLLETDLGQGAHHRRAGERLGQEDHIGVGAVDLPDHPLPEQHRLGVRVVHPEDPHPAAHPVPQHPQRLRDQPVQVRVEGDGVDVLVLLRRVLRIGDGAVRAVMEPLRVLVHPGMVRRALQREVQRHLQTLLPGLPDEPGEVLQRAQRRVHGVVPALRGADRPRHADVLGGGVEGVVAALAERAADGMDRREIHDVETHRRDLRQPARRRPERPVRHLRRPLGTGEELVPRPEQRPLPLHQQRQRIRDGHQLP